MSSSDKFYNKDCFHKDFWEEDDCKNHDHNHCNPCDFLCCSSFRVRLAGLQGNLNFQLFRFRGCKVKVYYECGGKVEDITGIICSVGTDFVGIFVEDHSHKEEKVVTIIIQRISKIEWLEKDCNPFSKHKSCNPCYKK